jgi:hypothetical protein
LVAVIDEDGRVTGAVSMQALLRGALGT